HPEIASVPVAFIDDDPEKVGKSIQSIPVVGGRKQIPMAAKSLDIDEIILAMPSGDRKTRSEILEECNKSGCKIKIVPGVYEFIDDNIDISDIREVQIEDLLGREQVELDQDVLNTFLKDKVVFVTGAGGTIGSELCRQILKFSPKKLIMIDIYENTTYEIQNEILRHDPSAPIEVRIDSIRDRERMDLLFDEYRPQVVFHAAAHKHVPLMEDSFVSAVKNNIFGTLNVLQAADKYGVEKLVNISTDKAVNPTSVMGCTKRVVEILLQTMDKNSKTDYVAVRFGNVLGSHGSVIPLFKEQIKEGGPVTVTHKDIIRFFMTIPEACQLVLQAGAIAKGGEIFVLEMGEPVRIDDLARKLISLSGFTPDVDIEIKYTGLRPGEKLYEETLIDTANTSKTEYDKIYIEKPQNHDEEKLWKDLERLKEMTHKDNKEEIVKGLKAIVPNFTPDI
ncbi:MAG: nucleoside-diphosphate sugar epimerase/dehydratase, partial [Tissierellia bacterium]|nr:nucleoside-diphosphate sugar epimerase/dehydratase [Tissierellia bacterium]